MSPSKPPRHAGAARLGAANRRTRPRHRYTASDHITLKFRDDLRDNDLRLTQWSTSRKSIIDSYVGGPGRHRQPAKRRSVPVGTALIALGILGSVKVAGSQEPEHSGQPAAVQVPSAPPEERPLAADDDPDQPTSPKRTAVKPPKTAQSPAPPEPPAAAELPPPEQPPRPPQPPVPEPPAPSPEAGRSGLPAPPGDPIDAWIGEATAIMQSQGYPPEQINPDDIRTIIEHESGGNPLAFNGWDSNAAQGTPSKGLMQTIDPTFQSFALPGHQNIWHPVDNIIAGTRYSIERYGSVSDVPGIVGKRSGGGYQGY